MERTLCIAIMFNDQWRSRIWAKWVDNVIRTKNDPWAIHLFLDVKGDPKDDYKFVIQLYNPSEISKGTEDIDKDHGLMSSCRYE